MLIGKLDRRITLLSRSIARDGYGDATEQFTELDNVWAQVIFNRGTEKFRDGQVQRQAQVEVTFRIRWRPDLAREMRVEWDGTSYDVTNVMEIGRRVGADLQAIASVS